jgi:hypothetical protein
MSAEYHLQINDNERSLPKSLLQTVDAEKIVMCGKFFSGLVDRNTICVILQCCGRLNLPRNAWYSCNLKVSSYRRLYPFGSEDPKYEYAVRFGIKAKSRRIRLQDNFMSLFIFEFFVFG